MIKLGYNWDKIGIKSGKKDMDGTFRLESRQLSPEQEAEELVRFLKEDPKWKRLDFYFSTNFKARAEVSFRDFQTFSHCTCTIIFSQFLLTFTS